MRKIFTYPITIQLILALALFMDGCRAVRNCPIKSLLIDESAFPPGSQAEEIISPVAEKPSESAGRGFLYGTPAYHYVGRYLTVKTAQEQYREDVTLKFKAGKHDGPWSLPAELTYISPIADEYLVSCGMAGSMYQCRMLGRYDEYEVFFWAYISDQGISLQIFENLLQAIDKNMANCFSDEK